MVHSEPFQGLSVHHFLRWHFQPRFEELVQCTAFATAWRRIGALHQFCHGCSRNWCKGDNMARRSDECTARLGKSPPDGRIFARKRLRWPHRAHRQAAAIHAPPIWPAHPWRGTAHQEGEDTVAAVNPAVRSYFLVRSERRRTP